MGVVAPIHTAAVGLANLRFFCSPSPGPQQPFHAVEDLHRCMSLPREVRREFRSKLRRDWRGDVRTIETADGPLVIGPHFMAQGLIHALDAVGHCPAGFETAYTHAVAAAMNVLTVGMSPREAFEYNVAAFHNSQGGA